MHLPLLNPQDLPRTGALSVSLQPQCWQAQGRSGPLVRASLTGDTGAGAGDMEGRAREALLSRLSPA